MNRTRAPSTAAPVAAPTEVDLLEALVVLLLRWRVLIGVPRVARAPAVGLSLAVPKTYASTDLLPDVPPEDGDSNLLPAASGFVCAVGARASSSRGARAARSASTGAPWASSPPPGGDNLSIVRADRSVIHRRVLGGIVMTFEATTPAQFDPVGASRRWVAERASSVFVRAFGNGSRILANLGLSAALSSPVR
jgi:hypothetical protein